MSQADYYPGNVIPQVRSPKPVGTMPNLKCPPDDKQQFILFDNQNLAVIKGWEWKANFPLTNFFENIGSFRLEDINLPTGEPINEYHTIRSNGASFICIFPVYIESELEDQTYWNILWRFENDPTWANISGVNSPEDEDTWRDLGRILMLSGTVEKPITDILLQNRTNSDITIKILIGFK